MREGAKHDTAERFHETRSARLERLSEGVIDRDEIPALAALGDHCGRRPFAKRVGIVDPVNAVVSDARAATDRSGREEALIVPLALLISLTVALGKKSRLSVNGRSQGFEIQFVFESFSRDAEIRGTKSSAAGKGEKTLVFLVAGEGLEPPTPGL